MCGDGDGRWDESSSSSIGLRRRNVKRRGSLVGVTKRIEEVHIERQENERGVQDATQHLKTSPDVRHTRAHTGTEIERGV